MRSILSLVLFLLINQVSSAQSQVIGKADGNKLTDTAWQAEWISLPENGNIHHIDSANQWICFRKSFILGTLPRHSLLRIAVDSKYWLYLNGKMVIFEGELKRGPNPRDTYFDYLDISSYLKKGKNVLAVLLWFWGKPGFSHNNSGKAGLVSELYFDHRSVLSDSTWKVKRHPAYGITGDPHPNYRLPEENIHFNALLDMGRWYDNNYPDSLWENALSLGKPPVSPWHGLIARPIPFWKVGEIRGFVNQASIPDSSTGNPIVGNLPKNLTITPYLTIESPAGQLIDIRTDNYKGGSEYNLRTEYITRAGKQEFEALAYFNGHSVIYNMPKGIRILQLGYRESRYNTAFTGSFQCNDSFFNTLWVKCRNTMNVNMRDGIQDPDRERSQWWGDAAILLGEILYACDLQAHPLIKKAINNLVDWQKPDSVLFSPIPASNWDLELPGQMLSSIGKNGIWYYFMHTGDTITLRHAYPAVKRYLGLWKLDSNGLVVHRSGGWDWGDWGDNIDRPVMDNALLYQALDAAKQMAVVCGCPSDTLIFQSMMISIAKNFNRVFWNGKEFRSPGYQGLTDDRCQGLAVLYGLAHPDQYPAIQEVLLHSFQASPYMEKYILESLFTMNAPELALKRMRFRYQKMVSSPITTLWEGWGIGADGYGGGSYNHGWSGGPLTLLMQYVCGIAPLQPGFTYFSVKPEPGELRIASARVTTVSGTIEAGFKKSASKFEMTVKVPEGTKALITLPVYKNKVVQRNGQTIWRNNHYLQADLNPGIIQEGEVSFQIPPGRWQFMAQ